MPCQDAEIHRSIPDCDGPTPMTPETALLDEAKPSGAWSPDRDTSRPGLIRFLVLSAWCGLLAGLLEVGAIIVRKQVFDSNHLYWISHHFVWLIPLLNLALFLVVGALLSILRFWRAATRPMARHPAPGRADRASPHLGRFPADLRPGRISPGAGYRGAVGPVAGAAS